MLLLVRQCEEPNWKDTGSTKHHLFMKYVTIPPSGLGCAEEDTNLRLHAVLGIGGKESGRTRGVWRIPLSYPENSELLPRVPRVEPFPRSRMDPDRNENLTTLN